MMSIHSSGMMKALSNWTMFSVIVGARAGGYCVSVWHERCVCELGRIKVGRGPEKVAILRLEDVERIED